MNARLAIQSALTLSALALLSYGLSDYVNAALGLEESLLNRPWQMLALALGSGLALGIFWPLVRGVRPGDRMVAFVQRRNELFGIWSEGIGATALEAGRSGSRIRVRLGDGSLGEGVVSGYAGVFSPATLKLTETERPAARAEFDGQFPGE